MAIIRVVRRGGGFVEHIADADLAAKLAAGYVEVLPPYIVLPDDNGAWDTGPTYIIAHPDGRRYAVTSDNFANYYAPLGFVTVVAEIPVPLVSTTRTTQTGDTRVTAAGDIRITEG